MTLNQQEQDVVDFQQYWLTLKKRWLPIVLISGSAIAISAFVTFRQKPVYQAEGKLRFDKTNNATSLTGVTEKLGELSGVTNLSNPLDTEAEVIRSNPIVKQTIAVLNLRDKKDKPLKVDEFLKKLKIASVKGTDILILTYSSTDAKEAANVINALISHYIQKNIERNKKEATAAREFLSKELPKLKQQVSEAGAKVRKFKQQYKVVALEEEAKVRVESLEKISEQFTNVKSELAAANTRSQALQKKLDLNADQGIILSSLNQSPAVQQVLTEYQRVQDQLVVERTRYTEEHPAIVNLLQKEAALKRQLGLRVGQTIEVGQPIPEKNLQIGELKQNLTADLVKAEVERLALQDRVNVLNKALNDYRIQLSTLPQLEEKQRELERELQVAQSTYQQLLKQFQEVQLIEKQTVGNATRISDAEVPEEPISPRIPLNLGFGGIVGIVLGLGTAFLLEMMDKSLKSLEETQRLLGYSLLGTIPLLSEKAKGKDGEAISELPVLNNPYSPVTSSFEMLQTNLSFAASDNELKVVVVTSSIPGEGKSFVSANLAIAIAQLGRRVLLIDADMRRSRQHEIWQLPNLVGLSNILVNRAELQSATNEALVTLDVLTAGVTPPNPLALLDSQKMALLIKEARKEYDFVIIDSPPLNAVADAQKISKLADGILLVVRPSVVNSQLINSTKRLLEQSNQRVLGIVVNGVSAGGNYGYYSKSYYGKKVDIKSFQSEVKLSSYEYPKIEK